MKKENSIMANYSRKIVADGIGYSTIIDPKFKNKQSADYVYYGFT